MKAGGPKVMSEAVRILASEVASQINKLVDLPFVNEEEEEVFFQMVVLKVFDAVMSIVTKNGKAPKRSDVGDEPIPSRPVN